MNSATASTFIHRSVLLRELVDSMAVSNGQRFIDGTLGAAGHAEALLQALPQSQLIGIDRDPQAIQAASQRLAPFAERAHCVQGRYSELASIAAQFGWQQVDGVFLDIGVSSPQIDDPQRGFSFRFTGPLDMRMNPQDSLTAANILNDYSEKELADIFYHYGEERMARRVARAVVARRDDKAWETTDEFAELLERIVGRGRQHGLPPATRCFQALRIAVNGELDELRGGLDAALSLLRPGGRLAVISFHSLEDRIVKHFLRHEAASCTCPPELPVCVCDKKARLAIITKRPITASAAELAENPRAASAKLRVAERLPNGAKAPTTPTTRITT
jgi:16S rRNA (cytosine1402-N4)-methyltransferase